MPQDQLTDDQLREVFASGDDMLLSRLTADERARGNRLGAPQRPTPSHETPAASLGPRQPAAGRGTNFSFQQQQPYLEKYGPAVGATLGAIAAPEAGLANLIVRPAMAFAGGYGGATVAGSEDPVGEGGLQALIEMLGGGGQALGERAAEGTMKGAVPKAVRQGFGRGRGEVNVPREMLDRGAFPGFKSSENRIQRLSSEANAARDATAATVPRMPAVKTISGLRPLYQKAKASGFPDDAATILEAAKKSVRDIQQTPGTYGRGLSGPQVVGRKDIFQDRGLAATKGSEALPPKIAEAQGQALSGHLRETPGMERALDESQKLMAVDKAMEAASYDNPLTRARSGGATGAALTPMGLGVTAHVMNQGSKLMDPKIVRLLQTLMSERSNTQEQE